MKANGFSLRWWHIPVGLFALLVVVPFVGGFISGLVNAIQVEHYTEEEGQMRERLRPLLDSIVTGEEDLVRLTGDFYSCEDDSHGTVRYDLKSGSDGGGGDVGDVEAVEPGTTEARWDAESEFCDNESESFVNSILGLPPRKDHLLRTIRVYTDLSNGDSDELSLLVDAAAASQFKGLKPYDAQWVEVPGLGTHGYAFKFKIAGGKYSEPYTVYAFFFIRGVVSGTVGLAAPSRVITDAEASSIAETMDAELKMLMTSPSPPSGAEIKDP